MSSQERPPQLDPALVEQWIIAAHRDLETVQQMYADEPALLHATWNWGGFDWEDALGAAAHTGQRAIALFLLENGARITLHAAAMLGKLSVVQAIIEDDSQALYTKGAHGIPLLVHARQGGEAASAVLDYLQEQLA